jgi:hypothetical protein
MLSKRCEHCRSRLFEVVPFRTTQQAIVGFAQRSVLPDKEAIIASRWMHPGLHCPNGCTQVFVEYQIELPKMTTSEAIAIGQQYCQEHYPEFIETHGTASRIVACVHCANFKGAVLEGWHNTHLYRNAKYRPLRNHKILRMSCLVPEIQQLEGTWWYDKGDNQPECDFFRYNRLFEHVYKDVTGWSEYPER